MPTRVHVLLSRSCSTVHISIETQGHQTRILELRQILAKINPFLYVEDVWASQLCLVVSQKTAFNNKDDDECGRLYVPLPPKTCRWRRPHCITGCIGLAIHLSYHTLAVFPVQLSTSKMGNHRRLMPNLLKIMTPYTTNTYALPTPRRVVCVCVCNYLINCT